MPEHLDVDVCQKITELRRVYGAVGIIDLLNVSELGSVKLSDISTADFDPAVAKRIRSGVRLYWKSWMRREENSESSGSV